MKTAYVQAATGVLTGILLLACGQVQAGKPSAKPFLDHPQPEMAPAGNYLYGKVVETMDSGGYTYVQLDTGGQKVWAAGPVTPVKKGDPVRVSTGMPMKNFHSKTLKRDFKLVYFSSEIKVAGNSAMMGVKNPHPGMAKPDEGVPMDKIKRAKNGKTVAEIFKDRKQLAGKRVRVRGKLIKYIGNIYGKNWMHIRDSSTSQDLLVITTDKTRPDDVVLVEGTVVLDKDNGIGQIYKAALEKASILGK